MLIVLIAVTGLALALPSSAAGATTSPVVTHTLRCTANDLLGGEPKPLVADLSTQGAIAEGRGVVALRTWLNDDVNAFNTHIDLYGDSGSAPARSITIDWPDLVAVDGLPTTGALRIVFATSTIGTDRCGAQEFSVPRILGHRAVRRWQLRRDTGFDYATLPIEATSCQTTRLQPVRLIFTSRGDLGNRTVRRTLRDQCALISPKQADFTARVLRVPGAKIEFGEPSKWVFGDAGGLVVTPAISRTSGTQQIELTAQIGTWTSTMVIRGVYSFKDRTPVWENTDAFFNYCVKENRELWSKNGDLYCLRPASWSMTWKRLRP